MISRLRDVTDRGYGGHNSLDPPINADKRRSILACLSRAHFLDRHAFIGVYRRLSADPKPCACIARAVFASILVAAAPVFAHGPDLLKGVGFDQHPGAQLPRELALQNDAGRRVTLGEALHGKPAVLVLGYLQCRDLCPTTLAGVTRALDGSGLDAGKYRALFVSIDPRESVAMLGQEKAERIAARDRGAWSFLRGDNAAVAKLSQAVGFRYRYEPARDAYAHAAGFAVVTPTGAISRYFLGVSYDPKALGQALRDAGRQEVAPAASPLLLLCYHFDPLTGRYTLTILGVLRVAIAVFFAAIALIAWRRHRRSRTGAHP